MSTYPKRLIPNSDSIILKKIDCNEIIGRANRLQVQTFKADGTFNDACIRLREIPKLSCNLLSLSEPEDLKLELLDESNKYGLLSWTPGDKTPNPEDIKFRYNNEWETYFFRLRDVEVETKYADGNDEYKIRLSMIHEPVLSNISHSEFEIIDERRVQDKNAKDRVTKFSEKSPKPGQKPLMHLLRRNLKKYVKLNRSDL